VLLLQLVLVLLLLTPATLRMRGPHLEDLTPLTPLLQQLLLPLLSVVLRTPIPSPRPPKPVTTAAASDSSN